MPLTVTLYQGPGPLPVTGTFKFQSTLEANVMISATAFAQDAGMISVSLQIDGNDVANAQVYANEAEVHKALVSDLGAIDLELGEHQFMLYTTGPNTISDSNDFYNVTLVY